MPEREWNPPRMPGDGEQIDAPQYRATYDRLQVLADNLRMGTVSVNEAFTTFEDRLATVGLRMAGELVLEEVDDEPVEPVTDAVPVTERWPQDAVWIMPTPGRRGPGRVADITRYDGWNTRLDIARRGGNGVIMASESRRSGYRRPYSVRGSEWDYFWWFLGWHDNGHPMFAVQMRIPITDEGVIRRAVREQISQCVDRAECQFCWRSFPRAEGWPVPSGHAAEVYVSSYGLTYACDLCSLSWERCVMPGCDRLCRLSERMSVVTGDGTTSGCVCVDHRRGLVSCAHCSVRFVSELVRRSHNCIDSGLDWSQCASCRRSTRNWVDLPMSSGVVWRVCNLSDDFCGSGLIQCVLCSRYSRYAVALDPRSSVVPGERICEQCVADHDVEQCEHCGGWWPQVDDHDCSESGECTCSNCRSDRVVRSYSYKPRPRFKGTDKHGLFLGMELEIFVDRHRQVQDVARATQDMLGKIGYLKSDGSISHGFEMVTHPMSYDFAMEQFPWDILPMLEDRGSYATDGAGIHIHASRNGFAGARHEYSWMIFAHRNQAQFSVLARRISNNWASFDDAQRRDAKLIATKKKSDTRRYRAINQTNSETIEVRIFMSTTDVQSAKATLGLVHASIEYTRTLKARDAIKDAAWSWSAFVKWVAARPQYAPLHAEMVRLNVVEDVVPAGVHPCDPRAGQRDDDGDGDEGLQCPRGCAGENDCNGACMCDECEDCYEVPEEDY